mgnify:CR=1 FL=1
MKKTIITGGTGFIGSNTLPYLSKYDSEFYLLGLNEPPLLPYENMKFIRCNLENRNEVSDCMQQIGANQLLHIAWKMHPGNYNEESNFEWLRLSANLLEEFKESGGRRVLITGSSQEYDWDYGYCSENTPISHKTVYGSTKNLLYQYASTYCKKYNLELVWPRLFFVYGPHEHPKRLISHIVISLLKNQEAIINNGSLYRDYMYVKDTADVISRLLFSDFTGVINIGSGEPLKLADIGLCTAELMGKEKLLKINYPHSDKWKMVCANVKRLRNEFHFKPTYSLNAGLKETIEWWSHKINHSTITTKIL